VELIRRGPIVTRGAATPNQNVGDPQSVELHLDDFAWDALTQESNRLRVSREELARFSLLYYLADLDSGRIARRWRRSPEQVAGPGG
jgi:hypothetical protein